MGNEETTEERDTVLADLASAVSSALGFTMVVANVYRPETDDYAVMVLRGPEDMVEALDGESLSRDSWMELLEARFERFDTFFVPEGEGEWGDEPLYEPSEDAGEGEDAWRKGDALFVPIRSPGGSILAILSVDMPASGRRPTDRERLALQALCARAGLELDSG